LLYFLASLKRFRRSSLRFANEEKGTLAWLDTVAQVAAKDASLAVEVARARSIVKGYSDTYERGVEKFGIVLACLPQLEGRANARERLGAIVDAALNTDDLPALKMAISEKLVI
jgi:indolepyruvate ferredoxin oxidoreductase beta subunit